MRNVWIIAKREFRLYFGSPVAYMILFGILLVMGVFFYLNIQAGMQQQFTPSMSNILAPLATLLMLATPAVTTRLLAEEQRLGTIELLLTAPVRDWELVVGKWLGGFLFMLTPTLISIVYPLLLNQLVRPGIDQGPVISGYLGVILLTAALVALGVAISSLFANQIAAFAVTIGFFIFIWWVLGPISQVTGPSGAGSSVITYLDFQQHFFNNLISGVIDLQDVAYFLSVTALGLFFGTVSVESRRWR